MTTNPIPSPVWSATAVAYVMSGYRGAAAVAVPLDVAGDLGARPTGVTGGTRRARPTCRRRCCTTAGCTSRRRTTQLLTVLDAKTGKPLLDRERLPRVRQLLRLAGGGRPAACTSSTATGTTVVLKAGDKPEVLATNKLDDPIDASPAAVGKTLFLRGEKHLYAIEEK